MDRRLWLAVALIPLMAMACADARDIHLGFAGPKTGENAETGKAVANGVQLAVDEWNAAGVPGRKRALLIQEDDAGDPAKGQLRG